MSASIYGWTILTAGARRLSWRIADRVDPIEPNTACKVFSLGSSEVCYLRVRPDGEVLARSIAYIQIDAANRVAIVNPAE